MTRTRLLTIAAAASLCLSAAPGYAQIVSTQDSLYISSAKVGIGKPHSFSLSVSVDMKTPAMTLVLPLTYAGHPDLHIDTTVGNHGVTYDSVGNWSGWMDRTVLHSSADRTLLVGFLTFFDPLPPVSGPLFTIHFRLDSTDTPGWVLVDSTMIPPSNHLTFVAENATEYIPQFARGVIDITDQVPVISCMPSSLRFTVTVDSANPAPKAFVVENTGGDVLHWTATDDQPWLSLSPEAGTNGTTVLVSVDISGLAVGSYHASISVSDPLAINSPQSVPVTLHVLRVADPADSDYVRVSTTAAPTNQPSTVSVDVSAGCMNSLYGMVIPLSYAGSPYVRLDRTAGNGGITWKALGSDPAWDIRAFNVDTVNKKVTIGLLPLSEAFRPAEGPLATIHFRVDSTVTPDTVVIDTTTTSPQNHLVFLDSDFVQATPIFTPGAIILEPFRDSLCASPEAVYINATQNGPLPPCTRITVENCGGISLWGSSTHFGCGQWYSGNVAKSGDSLLIDLCVTSTDLDTGLHVCSLTVHAERMVNSPITIPLYYRISPPPPPEQIFLCNLQAMELTSRVWDQVTLGAAVGATDGYDSGQDLFKPPPPPGEYVRVALWHPEWGLIEDDFSYDVRAAFTTGCKDWMFKVATSRPGTLRLSMGCPQPSDGLRWTLADTAGHLLEQNFNLYGYTFPTDGSEHTFVLSACDEGTFMAGYLAGWNLISSPLEPFDPGLLPVFGPEVDLWLLYGWDGGYFLPTEFHGCGNGYWLLLPEPEIIRYQGYRCGPMFGPVCVELQQGWNLVGAGFSSGSMLDNAQFDSAGVNLTAWEAVDRGWISPTLWGWNGSAYVFDNVFSPGAGYWLPALVPGLTMCEYFYPFRRDAVQSWPAPGAVQIAFAGTDVAVRAGLSRGDTGFDAHSDIPLAPRAHGAVTRRLCILSDMNPLFGEYYQDLRDTASRLEWTLALTHAGLDTLRFSNTVALTTEGYGLSLLDPVDSSRVEIASDGDVVVDADRLIFVAELLPTGVETTLPRTWYLAANVPNPFNPQTKIEFGLPVAGRVELTIYNVLGRRVRTLISEPYAPGAYSVIWDGRDEAGVQLPSGVYFYRLTAGTFTQSRKMVMIR